LDNKRRTNKKSWVDKWLIEAIKSNKNLAFELSSRVSRISIRVTKTHHKHLVRKWHLKNEIKKINTKTILKDPLTFPSKRNRHFFSRVGGMTSAYPKEKGISLNKYFLYPKSICALNTPSQTSLLFEMFSHHLCIFFF
jgi:hypothetical protein